MLLVYRLYTGIAGNASRQTAWLILVLRIAPVMKRRWNDVRRVFGKRQIRFFDNVFWHRAPFQRPDSRKNT